MNADEVEQLHELLKIHKKRVNVLEQQAAKYGINCPPEIKTEIEDIQVQIERFERNLQGDIIHSYVQGREALRQFNREMDDVTHGLSNVVVEEKRTYRFLGLPIWSVVISRTILTLLMIALGTGIGYVLPRQNGTGSPTQATALAATFAAVRATGQADIQAAQATGQAIGRATALAEEEAAHQVRTALALRQTDEAAATATAAAVLPTVTPTPK